MIATSPAFRNALLHNFLYLMQDPEAFEPTFGWAIIQWTLVADRLLSGVVPASTTIPGGQGAFSVAMAGLPTATGTEGITMLANAFQAYAAALAGGMTTAGFVGTPPPSAPDILSICTTPQTSEEFAIALEALLITWAHTGTATPVGGGTTINWT